MKRFTSIALAAAALTTAAFAKDANSDFKRFLVQLLPKLEKAFATKDASWFDKITTDDFTETMMGQTITKQQAMAGMKQQFQTVESCKAKFKILTAKVVNGKGIATAAGNFTMIMKPGADKKKHTMTMSMRTKETWVRSGNAWKLQKLEEHGQGQMKMDGKPFDPSKMMPPPPKKGGGN